MTRSRTMAIEPATLEDEMVVSTPFRPGGYPIPRPGHAVRVFSGVPGQAPTMSRIQWIVAFTRSWTTLELTSFDVVTQEGIIRIHPLPAADGLWIEARTR